jgi:hypothetical protein
MGWNCRYIILVVVWLAGCRAFFHPGIPPEPKPVANHFRAGQLVFHSDFELPREHRLVRDLVAERDDICGVLGLPTSDELINVHLYHDAETYRRMLTRHFPSVPSRRAFFLKTDTRLAVYAHWSDRVAEDLRHEVAHGYLHAVVPDLPLWLDEGLAEFFEVPRGQNGLNRPHLDLLADMRAHEGWQPNLGRLERLSDASQMNQSDYAEAWAWVYYLLQSGPERRKLLTGYLAELQLQGVAKPISLQLAEQHAAPQRELQEYLAGLSQHLGLARVPPGLRQ